MLSPSPLLHGRGQQSSWKQECESLVCSATDFNQMLCVSSRGGERRMVRAGFPGWKTARKKEGRMPLASYGQWWCWFLPTARGSGMGANQFVSEGKGKVWRALLLRSLSLSLSLWQQRGRLQLCAFCSRVCFMNCCRQRKVFSGLAGSVYHCQRSRKWKVTCPGNGLKLMSGDAHWSHVLHTLLPKSALDHRARRLLVMASNQWASPGVGE